MRYRRKQKKKQGRTLTDYALPILGITLLLYGITQSIPSNCPEPLIEKEGLCCGDVNKNGVCDNTECIDEQVYALNIITGKCELYGSTCLPEGLMEVSHCPSETCFDGIQNQDEEEIDAGGVCGAPHKPELVSCYDGIKNQGEEGVDCGGLCPPCLKDLLTETCFDSKKNQDEDAVDCGGVCVPCPPSCINGFRDGDEIEIDCGGSCLPCVPRMEKIWVMNSSFLSHGNAKDITLTTDGNYSFIGFDNGEIFMIDNTSDVLKVSKAYINLTTFYLRRERLVAGSDTHVYYFPDAINRNRSGDYRWRTLIGDVEQLHYRYDEAGGGEYLKALVVSPFKEGHSYSYTMVGLDDVGGIVYTQSLGDNIIWLVASDNLDSVAYEINGRVYIDGSTPNLGVGDIRNFVTHASVSREGKTAIALNRKLIIFIENKANQSWNVTDDDIIDLKVSPSGTYVAWITDRLNYKSAGGGNITWETEPIPDIQELQLYEDGGYITVITENGFTYIYDTTGVKRWRYFSGSRPRLLKITEDKALMVLHSGEIRLLNLPETDY